jgi:hypothetical protein
MLNFSFETQIEYNKNHEFFRADLWFSCTFRPFWLVQQSQLFWLVLALQLF